jgi:DNA-binding XRE family transcriptional regulator
MLPKGYNPKPAHVRLRQFKRKYNSLPKREQFEVDVLTRCYEIGKEVWNIRRENEITISKLSKMSGVSRKAIAKLEDGRPVKLDTLIRVLEALDKKISFEPTDLLTPKELQKLSRAR